VYRPTLAAAALFVVPITAAASAEPSASASAPSRTPPAGSAIRLAIAGGGRVALFVFFLASSRIVYWRTQKGEFAVMRGKGTYIEVLQRSRSKSSPLEKNRSKLANPVELSWGLVGVSTGVASFDGDLLIGIF